LSSENEADYALYWSNPVRARAGLRAERGHKDRQTDELSAHINLRNGAVFTGIGTRPGALRSGTGRPQFILPWFIHIKGRCQVLRS